jgi:hypothetical protein
MRIGKLGEGIVAMRKKFFIGLCFFVALAVAGPVQADGVGPGFCGCDLYHDGIINFRDFAMIAIEWWSEDCWPNNDYCNFADVDHSHTVRFGDIDVIHDCWLTEDTEPPTPDPMQWDPNIDESGFDGRPVGIHIGSAFNEWGATMRATPAAQDVSGLEFFFECTNDSGFNSGWITFPDGPPYIYSVLIGQQYYPAYFRVMARDITNRHNVTDWSSEVYIWD